MCAGPYIFDLRNYCPKVMRMRWSGQNFVSAHLVGLNVIIIETVVERSGHDEFGH